MQDSSWHVALHNTTPATTFAVNVRRNVMVFLFSEFGNAELYKLWILVVVQDKDTC
jgi:hypothetical protein